MDISSSHELILSEPIVEEALPQDLNALEDLILASFAEFAAKYATVRKYLRTIKKDLRSFWFAPDSNALCVHPTSDITAEEMPTPRPSPSASSAYRAPARELSTLWVIAALDQEGMPSNNRRLLGCLGLKVTLATDDSDSPETVAEIVHVCVRVGCRGVGLANLLLRQALERCRSLHIHVIHVSVIGDSVEAIKLYSKLGFELINTTALGKEGCLLHHMTLRLN